MTFQKFHSAAANRDCEVVLSARGCFTFLSGDDKSRGRRADLLYGSFLMSSGARLPTHSQAYKMVVRARAITSMTQVEKKREEGHEQGRSAS